MHHQHHSHVLQLDIQGTPQAWISLEHAAVHVATGSVAWVDGCGPLATYVAACSSVIHACGVPWMSSCSTWL